MIWPDNHVTSQAARGTKSQLLRRVYFLIYERHAGNRDHVKIPARERGKSAGHVDYQYLCIVIVRKVGKQDAGTCVPKITRAIYCINLKKPVGKGTLCNWVKGLIENFIYALKPSHMTNKLGNSEKI